MHGLVLGAAIGLELLVVCLEATVAELGGCVDELQEVQGLNNSTKRQTTEVLKLWQLSTSPIKQMLLQITG